MTSLTKPPPPWVYCQKKETPKRQTPSVTSGLKTCPCGGSGISCKPSGAATQLVAATALTTPAWGSTWAKSGASDRGILCARLAASQQWSGPAWRCGRSSAKTKRSAIPQTCRINPANATQTPPNASQKPSVVAPKKTINVPMPTLEMTRLTKKLMMDSFDFMGES